MAFEYGVIAAVEKTGSICVGPYTSTKSVSTNHDRTKLHGTYVAFRVREFGLVRALLLIAPVGTCTTPDKSVALQSTTVSLGSAAASLGSTAAS